MTHLDLFSGIGGFSYAADQVWDGVKHVFCDNDLFCQEVLKKHWPDSKIYGDIRTLTNTKSEGRELWRQDEGDSTRIEERLPRRKDCYILTGGFPCQPFSQAGRRKGTEDDRYLWPEMFRVIREFKPRWVVGENVAGFITWSNGLVLRQVFADLESEGYEIQTFVIPAVAVNAPHRRDRVWIVAHASTARPTGESRTITDERWQTSEDRRESIRQTHGAFSTSGTRSADTDVTDTGRIGQEEQQKQATRSKQHRWDDNWLEVATRLCRVDDGLPRRLDRNPRLKALGNAIVPQVAVEIMKAIKYTENPELLNPNPEEKV